MCRVAMWNKKGETMIENKIGVRDFMEYLEKSFGGHGNGFALLYEDGSIRMKKGVNLECSEIADIIMKEDYKWCVFHTRIASVGHVSDRNCHPFRHDNTVMVMNGTEYGFSKIGDFLGMTDTESVLRVAKKFNKSLYSLTQKLNSVFMGFEDGVPFVTAGDSYTDLELIFDGDAVCFASEFPYGVKSYEPNKKPFAWHEGKEIQVVEVTNKKHKRGYNSCYWDGYDYSNYKSNSDYSTFDSAETKESLPKVANGEDIDIQKDDKTKDNVYLNSDRDEIDEMINEIFPS